MTRTEAAEMQELNMTPEELVNRQAQVTEMIAEKPSRTPRSEGARKAWETRRKNAPQATVSADELMALVDAVISEEKNVVVASQEWDRAVSIRDAARKALHDYVYAQK